MTERSTRFWPWIPHLPTALEKSTFFLTMSTAGAPRPDRRVILTWCFFSSQLSTCFSLVVRSWAAMPDEKVSSFTCVGAAERIKTVYYCKTVTDLKYRKLCLTPGWEALYKSKFWYKPLQGHHLPAFAFCFSLSLSCSSWICLPLISL